MYTVVYIQLIQYNSVQQSTKYYVTEYFVKYCIVENTVHFLLYCID